MLVSFENYSGARDIHISELLDSTAIQKPRTENIKKKELRPHHQEARKTLERCNCQRL